MGRGGFFAVESLRGVLALVVQADSESRALFTQVLQYCGALVMAVGSADDALDVMRQIRPDVLVTDVTLPDHDGVWLVRQVRALKPENGGVIPAIAVTVPPVADDALRTSGFEAVLARPFDPWNLCRVIARLTLDG
jgi:CheY-like chemotaxis protein